MSKGKIVFEKDYDGESLYDLGRDIAECFDGEYNPIIGEIPTDEHGLQLGNFTVMVLWTPAED